MTLTRTEVEAIMADATTPPMITSPTKIARLARDWLDLDTAFDTARQEVAAMKERMIVAEGVVERLRAAGEWYSMNLPGTPVPDEHLGVFDTVDGVSCLLIEAAAAARKEAP